MNPQLAAAVIFARSVLTMAQIEDMKITNRTRLAAGFAPAYPEGSFESVAERNGVDHKSIEALLIKAGGG